MVRNLTRRALLGGMAASALTLTSRTSQAGQVQDEPGRVTPQQRATYLAIRERMLAAMPYERVTVPGSQALSEWERLKSAGRGWPVVIGDDEQLDRIAEQFTTDDPAVFPGNGFMRPLRSPTEILEAAAALEFPADLSRWPGVYPEDELVAPEGDWPDNVGPSDRHPSVALDVLSHQPLERTHILLIPASASWEVPAYLRWGDWNACPPPEYHVAALRSWHRRFGTELVGISLDTLNLRATRKPANRADALALAREQYRYCPDLVDQGTETLSALAAILMADDWWYFWWD